MKQILKNSQQIRKKNQNHYSALLNQLQVFFFIRAFILIFSTILIIIFFNGIQNLKLRKIDLSISEQHQYFNIIPSNKFTPIINQFKNIQLQNIFMAKYLSQIISSQYTSYLKHEKLQYQKFKYPITIKQKIIYQKLYNIKQTYKCINPSDSCQTISIFLQRLWARLLYEKSIHNVYIQYEDPLDQVIGDQKSIVIVPSYENQLNQTQMKEIFDNTTQQLNIYKYNNQLYMSKSHTFNLTFNQNYTIKIIIKINKQNILKKLISQMQLHKIYQYQLYDNHEWINKIASTELPIFSYKNQYQTSIIKYNRKFDNKTLIQFIFITPQIIIYSDFWKLTMLLPVLIFIFLIFSQKATIIEALDKQFRNTQRLISLYEFNINQIFTGNKPRPSIILGNTSTTEFFQQLSQIPSSDYQPIKHKQKQKNKLQGFKFKQVLNRITNKYNQYSRQIFKQKNKQIINNKFFIHSSVNQLSQAQSSKTKQHFNLAKQLGMIQHFFKFAYLSILLNTKQFDQMLEDDTSLLPQQTLLIIREINRTVSGTQVRKAFKLSNNIRKQTEQELQMRIQINLLQKYLQSLKDLDIHSVYMKELGLEKQIENLNQYIENIKHILNKHNKNIRTLGK